MKIIFKLLILSSLIFLLYACKTYYIPVEDFKNYSKGNVGNELDYITCNDKKGNTVLIKNDGSVEIRITDKNKKRKIGYFRTLQITDSTVVFLRSAFLSLYAEFQLDEIILIEIQNAKKALKYNNEKDLQFVNN